FRRNQGQLFFALYDNRLCAVLYLLKSNTRLVTLAAFSSQEGYKTSAMFGLLDHIITIYADTNLILDFEGSDLEGIAYYYQGFGAATTKYKTIYFNKLPFPLNVLYDYKSNR
ncbi:MAG: hypothetical protein SNJ71_03555, partial [Bacteroidales bacterium]